MKKLLTWGLMLAACLSISGSPAMAAPVFTPGAAYIPNNMVVCIADATAGYTNATTSATDITGATCALPAYDGDYSKQYIEVCFNADVTKATATTGAIGVYVNGALVTASKRFTTRRPGRADQPGAMRRSARAERLRRSSSRASRGTPTRSPCPMRR
jgi:hypothetical protein